MLAFSPFLPSSLGWESDLVSTPSNPANFNDDTNNSNSNSNKTFNSDYDLGLTFSPLFQALEGDNLDFQMRKFDEAQYHKQQPADLAGLGLGLGLEETTRAQQIGSSLTDREKSRPECLALAKKLNHNTRERDRRKRMNALYSALRALLPVPSLHKVHPSNLRFRRFEILPSYYCCSFVGLESSNFQSWDNTMGFYKSN